MSREKEHFTGKGSLLGAGLALLMYASGPDPLQAQSSPPKSIVESQTMTTRGKFYCNIKALNPTERAYSQGINRQADRCPEGHSGNRKRL